MAPPTDDVKALRRTHPTGWMVLTMHPSVPLLLDALLDAPPRWEFHQTEWAQRAGVSRESVRKHLPRLLDVGVVEPVEGTSPTRYRVREASRVLQGIHRLNSAVNQAGSGDASGHGEAADASPPFPAPERREAQGEDPGASWLEPLG